MKTPTVVGYRDKISLRAGETVRFMVSSLNRAAYQADLVRLISGNTRADYAGLEVEEIAAPFQGTYEGKKQVSQCGSWAFADASSPLDMGSFSFACAVSPWTEGRGAMTIASFDLSSGDQLALQLTSDSFLSLVLIEGRTHKQILYQDTTALDIRKWTLIAFSYDEAKQVLTAHHQAIAEGPAEKNELFSGEQSCVLPDEMSLTGISFGARRAPTSDPRTSLEHMNGRLDSPRLIKSVHDQEALFQLVRDTDPTGQDNLLGFWNFGSDMGGDMLADLSASGLSGTFKNLPTRAIPGIRWKRECHRWVDAPDEYTAVHFHEYDLYDSEWDSDFDYTIPPDLKSGIYAVRLHQNGNVQFYILFFVLPAKDAPKTKVAFLASTATYVAYANERLNVPLGEVFGIDPPRIREEQLLLDHPEFGLSHYDHHLDGLGSHFSSYLRPLVNWQPGVRVWAFNADLDIIRFLEHQNHDVDVITDEALHHEGAELLKDYNVIVTGTHPEYYSIAARAGLETYLQGKGRLMYMGGNGFYWKVAHSESWPAAIELRRAGDGTRAWASKPGEYFHQFDGTLGGMWRLQGDQAPQNLVGVGFSCQGMGNGLKFRRQKGADDPRAAFMMEGVTGDILCDFDKMNMSADGAEELDRVDYDLGTPQHALVIASSENRHPGLIRSNEEYLANMPQIPDPDIRADVTFFETAGGGAVFSTGSIAWSSVLAYKAYDNNTARLTANVLNRFADPKLFDMPKVRQPIENMIPQVYDNSPGLKAGHLPWGELLKTAFKHAALVIGMSIILKIKGMPTLPIPPERDSQIGE